MFSLILMLSLTVIGTAAIMYAGYRLISNSKKRKEEDGRKFKDFCNKRPAVITNLSRPNTSNSIPPSSRPSPARSLNSSSITDDNFMPSVISTAILFDVITSDNDKPDNSHSNSHNHSSDYSSSSSSDYSSSSSSDYSSGSSDF